LKLPPAFAHGRAWPTFFAAQFAASLSIDIVSDGIAWQQKRSVLGVFCAEDGSHGARAAEYRQGGKSKPFQCRKIGLFPKRIVCIRAHSIGHGYHDAHGNEKYGKRIQYPVRQRQLLGKQAKDSF
jgi:hypothetical protein